MTKVVAASFDPVLARIRVPFVQRASLRVEERDEAAFIVDLGLAGVFVERAQPLARGATVTLRFRLPGNAIPIVAECQVAWSKTADAAPDGLPAGVGLHFTALAEGALERLSLYLAEYCRRQGKARRFTRPWPPPGQEDAS
jgi:Tfp pilus assembly protein PilZ